MSDPSGSPPPGAGRDTRVPHTPEDAGSPPAQRATRSVLAAGIVLSFSHIYVVQPILPLIGADLGVGADRASLAVTATLVALAVANLAWGPVADRWGRKPVMVLGALALAVPAALVPVTTTLGALLALRFAQGLLVPAVTVPAATYVHEELAGGSGRAMSVYVGATALGGLLGRIEGGVLADLMGWRASFGVYAALTALGGLLVWALLPRSTNFRPRDATVGGDLRMHLADPGLVGGYVVGALYFAVIMGVATVIPYRLGAPPYDLRPSAISLVYLVYGAGALATGVGGRLVDRWGARAVQRWGLAAGVAALALSGLAPLPVVVGSYVVLMMAYFVTQVGVTTWITARAGQARASAVSLYYVAYYVCGATGAWLWSGAWRVAGWGGLIALGVATAVLAAVLETVLFRAGRRRDAPGVTPG